MDSLESELDTSVKTFIFVVSVFNLKTEEIAFVSG